MERYIGAIEAVIELKRMDGGVDRFPTMINISEVLTPTEALTEILKNKKFWIGAGVIAVTGAVCYIGYRNHKKHREEAQEGETVLKLIRTVGGFESEND